MKNSKATLGIREVYLEEVDWYSELHDTTNGIDAKGC